MNCQKFESLVGDLAREQMLETAVRNSALMHPGGCSRCAQKLADQRALTITLHKLARSVQLIEAPQIVEKNIVASFRDSQVQKRSNFKTSRWMYRGSAIAAMLLVIIGIDAARRFYQPVQTSGGQKSPLVTDVKSSSLPSFSVKAAPKLEKPVFQPKRFKSRPQVSNPDRSGEGTVPKKAAGTAMPDYATEIATEFMPLGYGNSLNLQDGGQIIRVEVPRSTLASFGLPVNTNRATERVKADLLLGADGSARAIRFVQ